MNSWAFKAMHAIPGVSDSRLGPTFTGFKPDRSYGNRPDGGLDALICDSPGLRRPVEVRLQAPDRDLVCSHGGWSRVIAE